MRARLLWRQATSSIGASIAIALIVAVAAGLFTAWPRLTRATFVDEFNYRIEQSPGTTQSIKGRQVGGWPVDYFSGSGWDEVSSELDDVVAAAGPTLGPVLGEPGVMLTIGSLTGPIAFESDDAPRPSDLAGRLLAFRAVPGVVDHVEIVDGEAPGVWAGPPGLTEESGTELLPVPVMFSTDTADVLGVAVGDVLNVETQVYVADGTTATLPVVVSGIFEATDADDVYWLHQVSGLQPRIDDDPNAGRFANAAAYINPDSALPMRVLDVNATTEVWIPVSAGAEDAAGLLEDLREVTARELQLGSADLGGGATVSLDSALIEVLERAIASQRGTAAVLTLVAAGPIGVTFALLALATRLSVSRRRSTLALASARGGAPGQIRGALGLEGLVVGIPAAVIGAVGATLAVAGSARLGDYVLPLLVALAPAVFLATASLPDLRPQRNDLTGRSTSRWRWVVEVLVVAAAAAAVYLLLSRGLQATTTSTVDPLTTGTPLVLSLATAVLATRLFPYPMHLVHAVARRRRGLASFLGSARALREGAVGIVPMLALLVATSIAMFSTTMLTTLTTGVSESAQNENGADVRLAGPAYFDEQVDAIDQITGVAQVSRVFSQDSTGLTVDTDTYPVTLYALDTSVLADVQSEVPGAIPLPAGMDELVDGEVPIVVSQNVASEQAADLSIRMSSVVPVQLVGTAVEAPGINERASWAIVDLGLLREVTGQNLIPRTLLVDMEPGADIDAAVTAMSDVVSGIGTISTVRSQEDDFIGSPSARSMQQGFVVALVLSVAQSVLALVLTLVLAAPERGRLIAVLRTLGIGPRDARRLVSWELVPLAAIALVAGAALGLVLPHLVVRTVDLAAFTGQSTPRIVYDWPQLGLVLAGVLVVLAITLLVASTIARRLSLSVLRIGDEST